MFPNQQLESHGNNVRLLITFRVLFILQDKGNYGQAVAIQPLSQLIFDIGEGCFASKCLHI